VGRIQRTMERREEKEFSKRIEKKSPRLEKQGEVRKAKAERERREKSSQGKLHQSVKSQLREAGLVDRGTLVKEVDGNTGQPVGQPISVTARTVSLIAKEVTEATQATITITGAESGAVKVITVTLQPGISRVNKEIGGEASPFKDFIETPGRTENIRRTENLPFSGRSPGR